MLDLAPPSDCGSTHDAARFTRVTECAGIATPVSTDRAATTFHNGIAWGDVDGDDALDLFVASSTGENGFYLNVGRGRFERHPDSDRVALPGTGSSGATLADYDNNGDLDLFVTRDGPNVLFANRDGRFVDITREAGLGDPRVGAGATWGDYDGDGDLDLYVVNWACDRCARLTRFESQLDRLYENLGDRTFAPADHLLGDTRSGAGFAATFVDVGGDGDVDLHVVNDKGYPGERATAANPWNRNMLDRNDGPGCDGWCFVEVGRWARRGPTTSTSCGRTGAQRECTACRRTGSSRSSATSSPLPLR